MKIFVISLSFVLIIANNLFAQTNSDNDYNNLNARGSINYKITEQELKSAEEKLKSLEESLLQQINQPANQQVSKTENNKQDVNYLSLQEKVKEQESLISTLKNQEKSYKNQNSKVSDSLSSLKNENENLRAKLIIAETQVERLTKILDSYNKKVLGIKGDQAAIRAESEKIAKTKNISIDQGSKASKDMPILTVKAKKANLRIGPGAKHSPLMEVAGGSRLVVEKRQGDWYRVISPNGVRAWISSSVVAFGTDLNSSPTDIVQIRGYNSSIEDRALIKKNS